MALDDELVLEASLLYENSFKSDYNDCFADSLMVEACQKYKAASVLSSKKHHGDKKYQKHLWMVKWYCGNAKQPSSCFMIVTINSVYNAGQKAVLCQN